MSMHPVIAIVGRPNVGKSSLFNHLTKSKKALILDSPGVTRDRHYAEAELQGKKYLLIDTGGFVLENSELNHRMMKQSQKALEDADLIFFMVDARTGLKNEDRNWAKELRKLSKPLFCIVNKVEGLKETDYTEFYDLGFSVYPISVKGRLGMAALMDAVALQTKLLKNNSQFKNTSVTSKINREKNTSIEHADLNKATDAKVPVNQLPIPVAIVGKPNAGKSSLINRILGEERMVVSKIPGTTRDSITVSLTKKGQQYNLIDTAGMRKKSKVEMGLEKYSVVKTLESIEQARVVLLIIDVLEGIQDQDLSLLSFIVEAGKSVVIALNKSDKLKAVQIQAIKKACKSRLSFAPFASVHFISAHTGKGVSSLFLAIRKAYLSAAKELSTSKLTRILEEAQRNHAPPMVKGRRIKLRYAHAGGRFPPFIIIHGNQTASIPISYKRYLMNWFIEALNLEGTPIRIEFKTSFNPYA